MSPKASSSLLPPSSNGPSTQDLLTGSPDIGETFSGNIPTIHIVYPTDRKGERKATTQTVREYSGSDLGPGITLLIGEAETSPASSPGLEIPNAFNKFSEGQNLRTPTRRRSPRGSTPEVMLAGGDEAFDDTQRKKQYTNGDHRDEGNNTIDDAAVDYKRGRKSSQLQRELGSLSPASTQLLSHLLESPAKAPSTPAQRRATNGVVRHNQSQLIVPPFPQPSLAQTPQRSTSPIRFSSPIRSVGPQSPSRLRLQPAALDDPNRTPARRIPIEEAIAKGRIFPSKASEWQSPSKLGTLRFQSPVLKIPANDSPARRMPISHVTDRKSRIDMAGPAQTTIGKPEHRRLKSSIVDTKERINYKTHQLSNGLASSGHPVAGSSTLRPADLPYPIVPRHAEAVEITNGPLTSDSFPPSSPSKSQLKQTQSRIPRAKPYARPCPKTVEKGRSVLVTETGDATEETSRLAMVHFRFPLRWFCRSVFRAPRHSVVAV